ncbi:alpha/beta-hydrolase [Pleurotus eryngii]|uniref:Alpha/beta-hydrolase n=1 Tax=Pleurotus eryngii TaxID=5323 RepID=A0A9P6DFR3_PLEER|nr:alpha/beta-hydrolase [Pleurotus eryngii]
MALRSLALTLAAAYISQPLSLVISMKIYPAEDIAALKPYTYYASTGYCKPEDTLTWKCGENCEANAQFQPFASGGDGNATQYWYAGYDPKIDSVIVGHQGVDINLEHVIMTVMDIDIVDPDPVMFPGMIKKGVAMHAGFMRAHASSAADVMAAVKQATEKHNTKNVTFVGHSLGAALGSLDAVQLSLQDPSLNIRVIGYGMPRVGNTAFADYVDEKIKVTRINNKLDPIPIVPPTEYGYYHPSGEIHILETGDWVVCAGQESNDGTCSAGAVEHMFAGAITDHSGPYDGVVFGCGPSTLADILSPADSNSTPQGEINVSTPEVPKLVEQDPAGSSHIFSTKDSEL